MTTKAETTSPSAAPVRTQTFGQKFKAYLDLGKPNLSGLVVITGITGFYVATPNIASALVFSFRYRPLSDCDWGLRAQYGD